MSKIKQFIDSIKAIPIKPKEPKYKVGDLIINHKFKIISKVMDIKNIFENEENQVDYSAATYILQDVKNEALVQYLYTSGVTPEEQTTILKNKARRRTKQCTHIDSYYDKIEGKAAQVLYGIKSEDE